MHRDLKIAGILAVALALSFSSAISTILSGIGQAFSDASASQVQGVYSIISLGAIPVILLGGVIATKINKKAIALFALFMILAGGITGYLGFQYLSVLYVSSMLIGGGINLGQTMLFSIISEEYDGHDKAFWGGIGGAAFSVSGVFYALLSGTVADHYGWHYAYLLSLVTVLWIALAAFFLPRRKVIIHADDSGSNVRFSISFRFIFYVILGALFMLAYNAYNTNVASLVTERNLGGASEASLAVSFSVFAGIPAGLLCGWLFNRVHNHFMSVAVAFLAGGLLITAVSNSLVILCIGSFFVGVGNGFRIPGNTVVISSMFYTKYNALGIGIYNAVGCISGFLAPYILNCLADSSESLPESCLLWSSLFAAIAVAGHIFDGCVLAPNKKGGY